MRTLPHGARIGAAHRGWEPPSDGDRVVGCEECGGKLDLSQPLYEDPERLVGACQECGLVYAIRVVDEVPIARILPFPRRRLSLMPPAAAAG